MGQTLDRSWKSLASIFLLASIGFGQANAPAATASPANAGLSEQERMELVNKLDELLQQNQKLEEQARQVEAQNRKLLDELREIREKLASRPPAGKRPAQA